MQNSQKNSITYPLPGVKFSVGQRKGELSQCRITNSKDVALLFKDKWEWSKIKRHERLYALYFNDEKEVMRHELINIGGHSSINNIDLRSIIYYAIEQDFNIVALAHNHPSGNVKPSDADITFTHEMVKYLAKIDIQIMDHIIISDKDYYSFRDNGLLD